MPAARRLPADVPIVESEIRVIPPGDAFHDARARAQVAALLALLAAPSRPTSSKETK